MPENPVRSRYSRHFDVRRYFFRDLVVQDVLKLITLRTNLMAADALTKKFACTSSCQAAWYDDWPRPILCSYFAP
jgi:hypothetical protein